MNTVNSKKLGIVFGAFLGLWHLVWSVLVAIGWAQPLLDFIFRLHMIEPPYRVAQFNLGMAITLIIVTTLVGYVAGFVIGTIWNRVHRG